MPILVLFIVLKIRLSLDKNFDVEVWLDLIRRKSIFKEELIFSIVPFILQKKLAPL